MPKKHEREYRYIDLDAQEVRAEESDDGSMRVGGYAMVWDRESEPIWNEFREVIRRESVKKTLKEGDQVAYWQHDTAKPLGRVSNNMLSLQADDHGLHFDLELPDSPMGHDADVAVRNKTVTQMSFGFVALRDNIAGESAIDGLPVREITEMRLDEVSLVTRAAYTMTAVEARSVMEAIRGNERTPTDAPGPESHPSAERLERIRALRRAELKHNERTTQ